MASIQEKLSERYPIGSVTHPKQPLAKALKGARTTAAEIMRKLDCEPIAILCQIATNQMPCGTCRGKGRTIYKLPEGQHSEKCWSHKPGGACDCNGISNRLCQSCYGELLESCAPELRFYAAKELATYKHPRFKQLDAREASGHEARNVPTINIVMVQPGAKLPEPRNEDAQDLTTAIEVGGDIVDAEVID